MPKVQQDLQGHRVLQGRKAQLALLDLRAHREQLVLKGIRAHRATRVIKELKVL